MKFLLPAILPAILLSTGVNAQSLTQFPLNTPTYVIAYKDGTNCSASAYNFYTLDLAGNRSATPFYTTGTTEEINGIGINTDGYGYGINYDRTASGSSCTFSNFRLVRFGASGTPVSLGTIAPPNGLTAPGTAIGFVIPGDKFVLFAGSGSTAQIGVISNISALAASTGTITPTYTPITYGYADAKLYADFARNPADGIYYTYATYVDNGTITGTVIRLDPATNIINTVGSPNTTEFTSANDNFGGTMFGADGMLYGVNINTRKFYKFSPTDGTVTYISTFAGSGNMRGDLGSNVIGTAATPLPLTLLSFTGRSGSNGQTELQWVTANEPYASFDIQQSENAREFRTIAHVAGSQSQSGSSDNRTYTWSTLAKVPYYRLQMVTASGTVSYSPVVDLRAGKSSEKTVSCYPNPVSQTLSVDLPDFSPTAMLTFVDALGRSVRRTVLVNTHSTLDVSTLPEGSYHLVIDYNGQRTVQSIGISR